MSRPAQATASPGSAVLWAYILVISAVYGGVLLGKMLPPGALLGGAVVLLGIWVVNFGIAARRHGAS